MNSRRCSQIGRFLKLFQKHARRHQQRNRHRDCHRIVARSGRAHQNRHERRAAAALCIIMFGKIGRGKQSKMTPFGSIEPHLAVVGHHLVVDVAIQPLGGADLPQREHRDRIGALAQRIVEPDHALAGVESVHAPLVLELCESDLDGRVVDIKMLVGEPREAIVAEIARHVAQQLPGSQAMSRQ